MYNRNNTGNLIKYFETPAYNLHTQISHANYLCTRYCTRSANSTVRVGSGPALAAESRRKHEQQQKKKTDPLYSTDLKLIKF